MVNQDNFERKPATLELLQRIWLIMLLQSVSFVVVVLVFVNLVESGFRLTEWAVYILGFGVISAVPSIPLLLRFRELDRGTAGSRRRDPEFIEALRTRLLIGVVVAELPALMGLVHATFTGQTVAALMLCLLTVVLVYFYRPLT